MPYAKATMRGAERDGLGDFDGRARTSNAGRGRSHRYARRHRLDLGRHEAEAEWRSGRPGGGLAGRAAAGSLE